MDAKTPRLATLTLAAAAALLLLPRANEARDKNGKVRLSASAFEYAKQLIAEGHVVNDTKGGWGIDQPSAKDENEFIRVQGFAEYAKWHLGINERYGENAKARYKFPYGDFKNVHRSGLLAVRNRARQFGYSDIDLAASELLDEISTKKSSEEIKLMAPHPTH